MVPLVKSAKICKLSVVAVEVSGLATGTVGRTLVTVKEVLSLETLVTVPYRRRRTNLVMSRIGWWRTTGLKFTAQNVPAADTCSTRNVGWERSNSKSRALLDPS